jgi:hypothetical protein
MKKSLKALKKLEIRKSTLLALNDLQKKAVIGGGETVNCELNSADLTCSTLQTVKTW